MRLMNFFRRAAEPSPAPVLLATTPPGFDLADTTRLHRLFAVARAGRDAAWRDAFFAACWNASVWQPDPPHFSGPDGLPYYRLNLPATDMRFEAQSLSNLARTCVARNAGAAFFARGDDPADAPQWVLSMGEIDSLLRFGTPAGDPQDRAEAGHPSDGVAVERIGAGHERLTLTRGHQILVGSPSAEFLPPDTARAIHRLMHRLWGIADPRVALLVDPALRPSRNLVVGRRPDDFADDAEAQFEMSRISWMLPPGRGLMLMPDGWSESEMTALTDLF